MLGEGPGRAVAIQQRLRVHSLQAARERQGRVLAESLHEEQSLAYGLPGLQSCQNKWPLFQATWVGSLLKA
jgi:hypothetical protein